MHPNKQLFGIHQKIFYKPFRVDRNNIVTGMVELHVQEDNNNPQFQLLDRLQGPARAGIPNLPHLDCVQAERDYDEKLSMAIYSYTYEGIFTNNEDPEFELDISMREEPIETHPNFASLANDFFWNYQTREFARQIVVDTKSGGLTGANNTNSAATSPMYGVTSYLVPGVIYRRSYGKDYVPLKVVQDIGSIVNPPGIEKFPSMEKVLGGNRNWLKLAPKVRRRGSCVEITEEYMLSGPRGVNTNVYSAGGDRTVGLSGL